MKAANLYAPGDIRVEHVRNPEPGPGEVLIKVKACGICGSDISRVMETGTYRFPTIPGHEFSGEVVGHGSDIAEMPKNLRVTVVPLIPCKSCKYCGMGDYHLCEHYSYLGSRTNGAFAEYVKAPLANLLSVPLNVDFELAAMTDPAAIALHAVRKLDVSPGDRVAIFGFGPIGAFALQWAKILGAGETIAVDIGQEKLPIAEEFDADLYIDAGSNDPVQVITDYTNGSGVEKTIEIAGQPITQEQCILVTAKGGSSVWVGISHRSVTLGTKAVDDILRKEMKITGSWNSSFAPLKNDWDMTVRFMAKGKIRAGNIISHRLPLEKIKEAFELMRNRTQFFNKVMFFPEM